MMNQQERGLLLTWGFGGHGQTGHYSPLSSHLIDSSFSTSSSNSSSTTTTSSSSSSKEGHHNEMIRECPSIVSNLFQKDITSIACGGSVTLALDSTGQLHCLSLQSPLPNSFINRRRPISMIACGGTHCLALETTGTLVQWETTAAAGGSNLASAVVIHNAAKEEKWGKIKQIACGGTQFSVVLDEKGRAFSWGINTKGELGFGDRNDRSVPPAEPVPVVNEEGGEVISISCGGQHTMFVVEKKDQQSLLYGCGSNRYGQLGTGNTTTADCLIPTLVKFPPELDSHIWRIQAIGCGDNHTMASLVNRITGEIQVFGWGRKGQFGLPSTALENTTTNTPVFLQEFSSFINTSHDSIVQISSSGAFGQAHTAILTAKGRLFMTGSSQKGQCGVVGVTEVPIPTQVESLEMKTVRQVSCGWMHTAVICSAPKPVDTTKKEPSPVGIFEELPLEAILYIFSLVPDGSLKALSLTSHAMHDLVNINMLWMNKFISMKFQWKPQDMAWEQRVFEGKENETIRTVASLWNSGSRRSEGEPLWKLRYVRCLLTPHAQSWWVRLKIGNDTLLQSSSSSSSNSASQWIKKALQRLRGVKIESRALMVGLDAAGKTTILYQMKLGEVITTIPTIGFNVETLNWKGGSLTVWDVGGEDKIRPLWRHYFQQTSVLLFVIDSNDRERLDEAKQELINFLHEEELESAAIGIITNKQDLPNSSSPQEIAEYLELPVHLRGRIWNIFPTAATLNIGISNILDWVSQLPTML